MACRIEKATNLLSPLVLRHNTNGFLYAISEFKCLNLALFILVLTVFSSVKAVELTSSGDALIFGVLPMLSTEKLVARFGPLADYLSKKLNKQILLETAPNYKVFAHRTNVNKRYDILITAPHFYYLAQRQAGYRAVAKVDTPQMRVIIVTHKSNNIHTVKDLRGHSISIPDPMALGSVLVMDHLFKAGLISNRDVTFVSTPSHDASLLAAYYKNTAAAGLMMHPFNRAREEIRENMRILAKTRGTPSIPISVAPTLTYEEIHIIENELVQLGSTPQGKALLKHLSWPGFVKADPAQYDQLVWAVEQLNM